MAKLHLTAKQLKMLKDKLIEEKEKLLVSEAFKGDGFKVDVEDQSDEVDLANADYNQSHFLRMRNREIFYAKKIEKSLQLIEEGQYGYCTDCGCEIKFPRLLARPTADLCIQCKEESERSELSNISSRKSKSLGESFTLVQG